ncbi:HAD family acid phosphatase [Tsuneonella sp. HG222]
MSPAVARLLAAAVLCIAAPAAAQRDQAQAQPRVPPGDQFLYGSGEAAAMSRQIYRALEAHVLAQAARRPAHSVVLAADATLAAPAFAPCGDRPLAVVFDVDETVALNTGLIHSRLAGLRSAPGAALAVSPVPGAVETIRALQAAGVTPVYNTNRTLDMTDLVAGTIAGLGLDRPVAGHTLFLNGMDALGANKDGRRTMIAAKWCVVAMAGDQLGDFSELLRAVPAVPARRAAVLAAPIEDLWGNGWFLLPNTSYGTALEGTLQDVFPGIASAANDNEKD